jgi:hypothetical protein
MRGSIILVAGIVLASNGAAYAQAVGGGSISRHHNTHLSHVTPVPRATAPHQSNAVASSRKPSDPETTGSIPKQR